MESVMPEVHKKVEIYEKRLKEGKLTPIPNKTTINEPMPNCNSKVIHELFKDKLYRCGECNFLIRI